MAKKIFGTMVASLSVVACSSLGPSAVQSITLPNGQKGFSIDCTHYAGWPACFEAAGKVCKTGYKIHERSMDELTKSEIPLEPLQSNATGIKPGHPREDMRSQNTKYMIISCN